MPEHAENSPFDPASSRAWRLPDSCHETVQQLFAETPSDRWHLSFQSFLAALTRGAAKRFLSAPTSTERLQEYLATLHVRDLALACACSDGSENAWDDFVAEYRGYLRAAAAAILRRSAEDAAVVELADSLFADLYGLSGAKARGQSLFRYFHGRSSLKTWLRAVLAQKHIDAIRAGKRFDSLDDQPEPGHAKVREVVAIDPPPDPHRELYLRRFREALRAAMRSLDSRDQLRLRRYYADERTLAEIGRELGEHESSVSRHLERVRKELRSTVEGLLRAGNAASNGGASPATGSSGMDDAQIGLCLQYAAEDAAVDLDTLLGPRKVENDGAKSRPKGSSDA